jgi:hypothetical protein
MARAQSARAERREDAHARSTPHVCQRTSPSPHSRRRTLLPERLAEHVIRAGVADLNESCARNWSIARSVCTYPQSTCLRASAATLASFAEGECGREVGHKTGVVGVLEGDAEDDDEVRVGGREHGARTKANERRGKGGQHST